MSDDAPTSYERINYALRPAKCVERKMMCDTFRRLAPFARVESYRYVGFGSVYFSDFILFHRALGMSEMISIEKDEDNQDRFEFNKPFRCVQLEFGESNDVLPKLAWDARSIVWLDYDGTLTGTVLKDVALLATNMVSGSVLALSYNVEPYEPPREAKSKESKPVKKAETRRRLSRDEYEARVRLLATLKERVSTLPPPEPTEPKLTVDANILARKRLQKLESLVGRSKVPPGTEGDALRGWGLAEVCRQIVTNQMLESLQIRNSVIPAGRQLRIQQLFNFHYRDGARMATVGFLVYEEGQDHIVANCAMNTLPFVRTGADAYVIDVPKLTFHEMRTLDSSLPSAAPLTLPAVPPEQIEWYTRVYRYFPRFAETDI